eukprot:g7586.t1
MVDWVDTAVQVDKEASTSNFPRLLTVNSSEIKRQVKVCAKCIGKITTSNMMNLIFFNLGVLNLTSHRWQKIPSSYSNITAPHRSPDGGRVTVAQSSQPRHLLA